MPHHDEPHPDGGGWKSRGPAPHPDLGWTYPGPDGEEQLTVCPRASIPVWYPYAVRLYDLYTKGVLLVPGGAAAQPAAYLSVMREMDREVGRLSSLRLERERQEHDRAGDRKGLVSV